VAGAILLATTPAAVGQAPGDDLEEIVVTGSRIPRPDFESASPIVTLDAEAFSRTSSTSVDTVVSQVPQFTPDVTTTSNNPANGGQGLQLDRAARFDALGAATLKGPQCETRGKRNRAHSPPLQKTR
jgi:outer membrane cobalamin receptor